MAAICFVVAPFDVVEEVGAALNEVVGVMEEEASQSVVAVAEG